MGIRHACQRMDRRVVALMGKSNMRCKDDPASTGKTMNICLLDSFIDFADQQKLSE